MAEISKIKVVTLTLGHPVGMKKTIITIKPTGAQNADFTLRCCGIPPPPGQPGSKGTPEYSKFWENGVLFLLGWPGDGGGGGGGIP